MESRKMVRACSAMSDSFRPYGLQPARLLLSTGFSRQEYWCELLCLSPGDLPDPGIEPGSHMSPALAGGFFTISTTWEAQGKKWYPWIYFQGKNRDNEVEIRHVDTWGGGRGRPGELWDWDWLLYTTMCKRDRWWEPAINRRYRELSLALRDDLAGWDRRGGMRGRGCI